jgi:L-xylulokinase
MAQYLLGIDNGGTVTKAALYTADGTELAVAKAKTRTLYPHPGHIERDLGEFWAANAQVIAQAIRQARIDPAEIAGVAAAGYGAGLYLVAEDGTPAWNGIISTDSRAKDYVERYYRDGTFDRVLPKICQSIWAAQPAALLPWFRDHRPDVLEKTRWILSCKDYIRYKLTGEPLCEITDSSGTSLVDVHDLVLDPALLDAFGISALREKFPPIHGSGEICGRVTRAAAQQTGLKEGTPVAGGLFDVTACAIASGLVDPEKLCVIAGTWSINEYVSRAPVNSRTVFMSSAYCMPGHWLILEASPTSASNLEWFVSELLQGGRKDASADVGAAFDECSGLVAGVAAHESEIAFLPFLYGSNAGPNASSCFIGMHGWHTKAHLLRAVFEGIAFSHKTHVDQLMAHRDRAAAVRFAGGAAKSSVWLQMFADVLQLPVELTAAQELGAMGAALCAGVAVGMFASFPEAVSRMVKVTSAVQPSSGTRSVYEDKYRRYQSYVTALRAVWDEPTARDAAPTTRRAGGDA